MKVIHTQDNEFDGFWRKGLKELHGATPMYSQGVRKFDKEIFAGSLNGDHSFIVISDTGELVAIVPLYCLRDEIGTLEYRYAGEYLRAPLIRGTSCEKSFEKTLKFILMYIEELAKEHNVKTHKAMIEAVDLLEGRNYYNYLTDFGYVDESSVCQLIEFQKEKDIDSLWQDLRKSYKPLIKKTGKEFDCEIITGNNYDFEKCEGYRKLHFKAAGRQTRSLQSFHLMYDMVKNNEAYICFIKKKNGDLVASHFFYQHSIYSLYSSSAIDPDLASNIGVGHLGLWHGILNAFNSGCRFFDMGQLYLNRNPSEKEKNIALFKKGFGGHTAIVFRGTKTFLN